MNGGEDITLRKAEDAMRNGEFVFHYQPKVSLNTGEILGAEALLRWCRPDGTVVPPGAFLPLLEEAGLMSEVTSVMLPGLVRDIETLKDIRHDVQVALNVSAADLQTYYLCDMLERFIASKRIGPGNIQIEVTETALIDDEDVARNTLHDLIAMGVEIAMDDYGTGYSSLDLLSRFPFSTLKLDHGVVRRMSTDAKNTHIVRASLTMAREMSLKTVAEGVETDAAYYFLAASGCWAAQGFWMSPAIPIDAFAAMLRDGQGWPCCSIGLVHDSLLRHLSYRRKVLDLVYTSLRSDPQSRGALPKVDLIHNAAHCRFNRFYRDGTVKDFEVLDAMHRGMHQAGKQLVELAENGAPPQQLVAAIGAFMDGSSRVDAELSHVLHDWLVATVHDEQCADSKSAEPDRSGGDS